MKRSIDAPGLVERRSGALGLAVACAAALASTDCTRDHDALVARPHAEGGVAGTAGVAGAGATSGSGSGFGGTGGSFVTSGGTGGSGGTGVSKPSEPTGWSVATFLHAVVDAPLVSLCFAKNDGGGNELVGKPRPASGLSYGEALVLGTLKGVDLEEESLVPFVITGDLSLLDGLACDEAVALAEAETRAANGGAGVGAGGESSDAGAGGEPSSSGGAGSPKVPRLRVARLPELAPGALTAGRSLLYAMVGCLGGPAFTHDDEEALCGDDYAPDRPTISADVVQLSRKTAISAVALQVLHASRALPALSVRVRPPESAVEPVVYVTDEMTEGMLRPREPRRDTSAAGYGVGARTWRVQALAGGEVIISDGWDTIHRRSTVTDLQVGRGYTLVVMGPSRVLAGAQYWNPPGFTVVDNDPMP
jgi:hypothetical protein